MVTGGTGFIGGALVSYLFQLGEPVRMLLRPSKASPKLPVQTALDVAVSTLDDPRSLRASMKGVTHIVHLAGAEHKGLRARLMDVDVEGTRQVLEAAVEVGVKRIIYLSHLGADRSSAYPVLKAKAMAEGHILRSGMDFTILRSAVVFGKGDHFTTSLARLLRLSPGIFLVPGHGRAVLQPIWVEDLAACLVNALQDETASNRIIAVGGGEHLSFNEIIDIIAAKLRFNRRKLHVPFPYMRTLALLVESLFPRFPVSVFWLDYLSTDRACGLDTLPRQFGIIPARLSQKLEYLDYNSSRKDSRNSSPAA